MRDRKILNVNQSVDKLLRKAYQLKYFPVGIKFLKKEGEFPGFQKVKRKKTVCSFIKLAARGESFFLDKNSISCPGGLRWMGFPSKLAKTFLYELFLGRIEKIKSSPGVAKKFLESLPRPPKEGRYKKIFFSPLKNYSFEPDVILIITTPRQAYRIIATVYLNDRRLVKIIPLSAACHGVITIPFVTKEVNVSLIDPVARQLGGYNEEDVLVGIPKERFFLLTSNLKKTPYGVKRESSVTKIIKKAIG